MVDIEDELGEGDIHQRDKFQFELKSEYSPVPGRAKQTYTCEFYFFVPHVLQINKQTYTKEHFYYDQTNFIRFKTPQVSLKGLAASYNHDNPLNRLREAYASSSHPDNKTISKELRLFGNIVRSAVRDRAKALLTLVKSEAPSAKDEILLLCQEVKELRSGFLQFLGEHGGEWRGHRLHEYSQYVDEFVSITIEYNLTAILDEIQNLPGFEDASHALTESIVWESKHRDKAEEKSPFADDPVKDKEYFVYRSGLLKKFVGEVLFLDIVRVEPAKPFQEFTAALAAGVAMLFYLYFLSFHGGGFVLDSTAFIVISVLLYILKDRLKDGIKNFSAGVASRWFPDYTTKIQTSDEEKALGALSEYFSFVSFKQLPSEIQEIRNTRFHTELERAKRIENTFYFKKEVTLFGGQTEDAQNLEDLNDIFRYNISRFLLKASDAYEQHVEVDTETGKLETILAPKVYHINIIMKNSYVDAKDRRHEDLRKFRVVLDKEGIKRIEKVL